MATRTRLTSPPTPTPNDIGVVPRWRAWTLTALAFAVGWGTGAYGLGNTIATAVLAGFALLLCIGAAHELRHRATAQDFKQIRPPRTDERGWPRC